jgi:hypothetical protein
MAAEPKGLLAIIGKDSPPAAGDDEEMDDPKVSAIRRFREALDSGDDEAAAMAFQDAYDACGMKKEEPEEAEEEAYEGMA